MDQSLQMPTLKLQTDNSYQISDANIQVDLNAEEKEKLRGDQPTNMDNEIMQLIQALTRAAIASKTDLRKYCGGMDFDDWSSEFLSYGAMCAWTDCEMITNLPRFLEGMALDWFKSEIESSQSNLFPRISEILNRMESDLISDGRESYAKNKLKARIQQTDEPVISYFYAKKRLRIEIDRQMEESKMIGKIKEGFLPSILEKIACIPFASLRDLLVHAKATEKWVLGGESRHFEPEHQLNQETMPSTDMLMLDSSDRQDVDETEAQCDRDYHRQRCFNCRQRGHVASDCQEEDSRSANLSETNHENRM